MGKYSQTIDGVTISITRIIQNVHNDCKDCWEYQERKICDARQDCNIDPCKQLCYTELNIFVRNYSDTTFHLYDNSCSIVDDEAFTYGETELCGILLNKKYHRPNIKPYTCGEWIQTFPEIQHGRKISRVIIEVSEDKYFDIEINPYKDEILESIERNKGTSSNLTSNQSYDVMSLKRKLRDLKLDIYSRLNNTLTRNEKIRLDNSIKNCIFSIELLLSDIDLPAKENDVLQKELSNATANYKNNVDIVTTTITERISTEGIRPDLGNTIFRSSWEANSARILNQNKINWTYETERYNLGEVSYLPDFFIGTNTIIEVKGFWDIESVQRVDAFIRTYSNKNFIIIDKDNYPDINIIYSQYKPVLNWEDTPCAQGETTLVTVVGLQFIPDKSVLTQLHIGDNLKLVAEPNNQYDSFAIAVHTLNNKIVGHLEKQFAAIYSWKLKEGMDFKVVIETIKPKILKVKISRTNWDTPLIPSLLHKKV